MASDFPFKSSFSKGNDPPDLTFTCTEKAPVDSLKDSLPVYSSIACTEDGKSILYIYHYNGYDLLRFTDIADFYLSNRRIICHLLDPAYDYLVEIRLLGPVLSFWLERSAILALHASAVVVEGRAVAFISGNGAGKSSVAAAFMQNGNTLLSDDILPVEYFDGDFIGRPGQPQMRMWPKEARYFLGNCLHLEKIHPLYSKRRVSVGPPGGWGLFCDMPKPLACIYFLERAEEQEDAVEVTSISPADAVIKLVCNSFIAEFVESMQLQSQRLTAFARMVKRLPMRRVLSPPGLKHIPDVHKAIVKDLSDSLF